MKLGWTKLYEGSSALGKLEVLQDGVERKLLVNGATQSIYRLDGTERGYWPGLIPDHNIKSALLLGLGGGTVARLLRKLHPNVKIVAYEVDPAVVEVARKYFDLDWQETEVRVADAGEAFKDGAQYDLVVVDLYEGLNFLKVAESLDFIEKVGEAVSSVGSAGFNRIGDQDSLKYFKDNLKKVFSKVEISPAGENLIYWGSK